MLSAMAMSKASSPPLKIPRQERSHELPGASSTQSLPVVEQGRGPAGSPLRAKLPVDRFWLHPFGRSCEMTMPIRIGLMSDLHLEVEDSFWDAVNLLEDRDKRPELFDALIHRDSL